MDFYIFQVLDLFYCDYIFSWGGFDWWSYNDFGNGGGTKQANCPSNWFLFLRSCLLSYVQLCVIMFFLRLGGVRYDNCWWFFQWC